jgi:hypothetical protein
MAAPSEYNIEVESILGGLESALARGQPLEKAMSSFRNAGYKEENIKEALKKFQVLHRRSFHELAAPTTGSPKKIVGALPSTSEGAVQTISEPERGKEWRVSEREEIEKPKSLVTAQTRDQKSQVQESLGREQILDHIQISPRLFLDMEMMQLLLLKILRLQLMK